MQEPIETALAARPDEHAAITVAVIDDDVDIRNGLWWLFNNVVGLRCEQTYAGCKDFLAQTGAAPEVLLLDVAMPEMSGLEGLRRIKAQYPALKIIMHSNFDDEDKIMRAQREGACGYVLKNASAPQLYDAIQAAHRGGQVWPYGFAENSTAPSFALLRTLIQKLWRFIRR